MKGREGELNHHSKQFGGSGGSGGGQARVHHTVEGDRRGGDAGARKALSPLGGRTHPDGEMKQIYEEKRNRAQTPRSISSSNIFKRFER